MKKATYYDRLQVHPRASQEVIKAAYRALMMEIHPDHNKSKRADSKAQNLNEAYEVLSDVDKRKRYDRELESPVKGKILGGFRVLEPIAEGGFGKTYKGEHVLVGEKVCIKHCSEISPDSEAILIEEAKAMWDLRHYSIPAARDLLRLDDNSLALVMSYIPGPTLYQIIEKQGRMDPEHVAWISQRILNALMYMHERGIVHGDLKPQNVIVEPESHTVVLVDFGLAMIKPKRTDASKGYTDIFAPPEQLVGGVLIPESDLYSLGMTMIFALCGGSEDRLVGRQIPTSVPAPLEQFIKRLIVREPLSRPRVWKDENLYDQMTEVRERAFGRSRSGMKPLKI